MKRVNKPLFWLLLGGLVFLSSPAFAAVVDYKCFAKSDQHREHIILVYTTDLEDAKRAALESTIETSSGRTASVVKVFECKLEHESFSSARARNLEQSMPR